MKGENEGFICEDAKRSSVGILLDVRGFLGDYCAASQVIHILMNSAGAS